MKKLFITVSCLILCISFFTVLFIPTHVIANDSYVRAKIGILIRSGENIGTAKSHARLKNGDSFQIYIHTEDNGFIYVIHTNNKVVSLLNITKQKIYDSTLILPSTQLYYHIDGHSPVEKIIIICSPHKLSELKELENNDISHAKWIPIQRKLVNKSRILLTKQNDEAFLLGGNVRGISDFKVDGSFSNELQIYSGKGLLVKNYEFKVEK